MSIPIKLDAFEGPLDLLLHLIDVNKINIYDIPISLLTDQYLEAINYNETKDMDSISEFLVMASTLLRIKSKMLLPHEKDPETGEEIDPRAELVERLLEYKMYKYTSIELKSMATYADKVFYKEESIPDTIKDYHEPVDVKGLLNGITLTKLNNIFEGVMRRREDKIDPIRSKFGKIEKEEVTLPQKMFYVQTYGLSKKKFWFRELLETGKTKMDIIVTFLCVLELMKMGRIEVKQEDIAEDMEINYLADDIVDFTEDKELNF